VKFAYRAVVAKAPKEVNGRNELTMFWTSLMINDEIVYPASYDMGMLLLTELD
jgi:hypothetical protein